MSKVIGIDLGTSKTMAFEYDDKTKQFYSLTQDEINGTPSIFCYSSVYGNTELIGSKAINCLTLEPENVVTSIKTKLLGPAINVNDMMYEPKEIFDKLTCEQINEIKTKYQLNHFFSEDVDEAVITVPISFGNEERKIYQEILTKHHIKIKEMISEPSAAALVLNEDHIIVIDIGAGTLDLTALTRKNGIYNVKDVYGNKLAGDKFDEVFMNYCIENGKLPKNMNSEDKQIARFVIKEIKEKLSFHDTWTSKINFKYEPNCLINVTASDLEKALNDEFNKIVDVIQEFANKNKQFNQHILVTGRSCMIPALQKRIREGLSNKYQLHFYDTSVIAKGAAIYASQSSLIKNHMIQYSYYLEIVSNGHDILQQLVPAKVGLPYSKTINLRTTVDNGVSFSIYEVENNKSEYLPIDIEKRLVENFLELKTCPANTPFNVMIHVDQNGILSFKYDLLNEIKEKRYNI